MPDKEATAMESSGVEFSISANGDAMALLVEILSDQHAFFAGVLK